MRLATVNGVKQGKIHCTMAIDARGKPMMGQYAMIQLDEDILLGRFGSIDLTNAVHDNPALQPYIMVHGLIPGWSKDVDIETGILDIIGVIDGKGQRIPRRTNPSSGTEVQDTAEGVLERFYNDPGHCITVGMIPNTEGLPATLINRHFGEHEEGGYGEARHSVIFGQTGSGKSVWASMLLALRLVANPQMGLLLPDTAGDLTNSTRHNRGTFRWDYRAVLRAAKVAHDVLDIQDIRLTDPAILEELLPPLFNTHLQNMHLTQAGQLATRVRWSLFGDQDVDVTALTDNAILSAILTCIPQVYATGKAGEDKLRAAQNLQNDPMLRQPFARDMLRIRQFFDGREKMGDLIRDVLEHGRKVLIQMYASLRNDEQDFVMREVMQKLVNQAYNTVRANHGKLCNALVVLDEGSRWVPEGRRDDTSIGAIVEHAFNQTRKLGLGWMVISQRPSHISKEVIAAATTKYFGRGVGVGQDRAHLEQNLTAAGVEAYDQLEQQGGYFWVGIGQDANLGTEGMYFTIHPFGGDASKALMDANPHLFRRRK